MSRRPRRAAAHGGRTHQQDPGRRHRGGERQGRQARARVEHDATLAAGHLHQSGDRGRIPGGVGAGHSRAEEERRSRRMRVAGLPQVAPVELAGHRGEVRQAARWRHAPRTREVAPLDVDLHQPGRRPRRRPREGDPTRHQARAADLRTPRTPAPRGPVTAFRLVGRPREQADLAGEVQRLGDPERLGRGHPEERLSPGHRVAGRRAVRTSRAPPRRRRPPRSGR